MKRLPSRIAVYSAVTLVLAIAGIWVSAQLDLTTFTPGTTIRAAEVNANFEALETAVTPLQGFVATLASTPCGSGEAIAAVATDGTPGCVAVGDGGGLTSVATAAGLAGDGTPGNPLGIAVPLALSAGPTEALELTGSGTGIGAATLRVANTGGGIGGWIEQTGSGSSDTALGLRQLGSGPFLKMFGPNGGNEEIRIAGNGTVFLFEPGASTTNDFNIKLDNGNGNVTAAAFNTSSDAALKGGFAPVEAESLLDALAGLSITRWHFLDDPDVVHLGPTAQDFRAAFGLGTDERHIATVDADGVALAAIQELYARLLERDARIAALEARLAALERAAPD